MTGRCPFGASRRGFLAGGALGLGATLAGARAAGLDEAKGISPQGQGSAPAATVPFHGPHQAGIETATQNHTYFAALDVVAGDRTALQGLLRRWTEAAARMAEGKPAQPMAGADPDKPAPDTGETFGMGPARLTVTFGFGATLFEKDGKDRFGLAHARPEALVDMPVFTGDQLEDNRTGGDLSIQACADDPQIAFHAVRQLARMGKGITAIRWTQTGFTANFAAEDTPRNLMGFKDGTQNPVSFKPVESAGGVTKPNPDPVEEVVWAGAEAPAWIRGGSYMVVRRIRIALEHWDDTEVSFQEQTIGRHKVSGAPLGGKNEFDALDLDAVDKDGNPLIADNAHVRMAAAASNGGAQILRRGYSYNDGTNVTAERWPPWRHALEYDAGLLFVCYQKDPRTGFIRIFEPMAKLDALNQYATHTGGGLFAIPPGIKPGEYIGQALFA